MSRQDNASRQWPDVALMAVAAVLSATSLVLWAVESAPAQYSLSAADPRAMELTVEALRSELKTIREMLKEQGMKSHTASDSRSNVVTSNEDVIELRAEIEKVLQHTDRLEGEVLEWMEANSTSSAENSDIGVGSGAAGVLGHTQLGRDAVAQYRGMFFDHSRSSETRLRAFAVLSRFPEEMAAIDGAVVNEMMVMMTATTGADLIDVMDHAESVRDDRIVGPVIGALEVTSDPELGYYATRVLRNFLHRSDALAALEQIAGGPQSRAQRSAAGILAQFYLK